MIQRPSKSFSALLLSVISVFLLSGCSSTAVTSNPVSQPVKVSVVWCFTNKETKCYEPISVPVDSNGYDSLVSLDERESDLSFTSIDYAGTVGHFVNSINGIKGDNQNFWKLYYKGKVAEVGINSIKIDSPSQFDFKDEAVR